jgi:hypothetical protein
VVVDIAASAAAAVVVLGDDDGGGGRGVQLVLASSTPGDAVLDVSGDTVDPAGAAGDEPETSALDEPVLLAGRRIVGTTPGAYVGERDEAVCDRERLAEMLTGDGADTAAADAWFAALDRNVEGRATYLDDLTGVHLRYDTRVTAHGADGAIDAVLQAGTAVLIDRFGVPRVRCAGGVPLDEPAPAPSGTSESGSLDIGHASGAAPWAGFDPASVVVVAGSGSGVDSFDLAGAGATEPFTRPAGSDGERDRGVFSEREPDDCESCPGMRISVATVSGTPGQISYETGGRPTVEMGSRTELVWRDGTAEPGTFTYSVVHVHEVYMHLDPDTNWTADPAVYDDPRYDDEVLVVDAANLVVQSCRPGDVTVTITVDDVVVQTSTETVPCGDGTTFTFELAG